MSWVCFGLGRKWLRWCSLVVVHGDFGDALTELPALSCFRYKMTCRDGHRVRETLLHPAGQVALLRLQRLYLSGSCCCWCNLGKSSLGCWHSLNTFPLSLVKTKKLKLSPEVKRGQSTKTLFMHYSAEQCASLIYKAGPMESYK